MISDNLSPLIARLIDREQGFVNDPSDHGGPTKYGITMQTLAAWRGKPVSISDIQNLTEDEADLIYRSIYWIKPGLSALDGKIHPLIIEFLFDVGVNSGPKDAAKLLQEAAGITGDGVDGVIGPITIAKVSSIRPFDLASGIMARRGLEYGRIIGRDPSQEKYFNGWANRLAGFIARIKEISG